MAQENPGRRLIEAGSGRVAAPLTTGELRDNYYTWFEEVRPDWQNLVATRMAALQSSPLHGSYTKERNALTSNKTRQEIVDIYERAYSELAEEYQQLKKLYDATVAEEERLRVWVDHEAAKANRYGQQASRAGKRLWAVLSLLEQRFDEEVNINDGQYPYQSEFEGDSVRT